MVFNPKALIATALFAGMLLLALNFRLGLMTCILAFIGYVGIEMMGMGIGSGVWRRFFKR